ncbi:MAG: hypothetical protein EA401_04440 [Planctomycetota bacterium]|nr:MAG: hypothetical protein EA401_04440 [Planctomycetota bacterium]
MSPRLQITALFILAFLGGGAFLGYHLSQSTVTWNRVDTTIAESFPDLPTITVEGLDAWLSDEQREPPLILDAREPEEFELSHIPGAQWLGSGREALDRMQDIAPGTQIVVYSAVGLRAAPVVRDLHTAGFDARHLTRGIFAWANADLPVIDAHGNNVPGVHRWNATMQRLLESEYRLRP